VWSGEDVLTVNNDELASPSRLLTVKGTREFRARRIRLGASAPAGLDSGARHRLH